MSKKIKYYVGGVNSGMVTIGDPFEILPEPFKNPMILSLKKKLRSNRNIVDGTFGHRSLVLMKVSDTPCSLRVTFHRENILYKSIILTDISYDTNKSTRQNRILTNSGYLIFSDPCYIVQDTDNIDIWSLWLKKSLHKYDSNGYMLYTTFDRDDGEFGVSVHKDYIKILSVMGYAKPMK